MNGKVKKISHQLPLAHSFLGLRFREVEIWMREGRRGDGGIAMVEWAPFPGLHYSRLRYRQYLRSELDFFHRRPPPLPREVVFYGLIAPGERNEEELRRQERFSTIKVKCARHSLADDIRYFGFLARRFPAARFRVDANRRWSADELRAFAGGVDMGRIDYFEEPTPNSLELAGHYPIALDETALEYASRPIAKGWQGGLQRAKAIVVKPHLYVHIHQVLELLQWGVRAGIPMVLSSLFNSSVGTQNLLRLACLYPENTATAHGLGPFCYLAQDTVENPLSARGDCFPREEVAKQLVVREGGR